MNRVIFNAYQNACDCIYYGYGKSYWDDCGLDNESIANQVWKAAKNDLASNDTNRPYDEPSVETKKTLENLSKEYEKVSDSRKVKDNNSDLFDKIDADLAKAGKVSRFYSDDENITITTDYNTYKVNRSMLDGIMGDYGYEFYDYGDNGDKVMITYNKVSDSRKVKDDLDEDMKLWESRSNDEFGKVLHEIEQYAIDLWGTTKDYEVPELEQSIISQYITTYELVGDRNYVARRVYNTLENFDMIDNMDDPHFMELVNQMLKLGGVNNISDSRKVKDNDDEYLLQEIARQLEEGYYAGYEPQWDIDITVDGMDISEFDDYDQDLIYQDIAYVVKDGYDNYMGIETELSDGSIVYVDFVLNY